MTTEQTPHETPSRTAAGQEAVGEESSNRWHRGNPTFIALSGFFAGMLSVMLVPGAYAGILRLLFEYDTAERLFPYILLILIVPAVLAAVPRTRRFGTYMFIGMALTTLVVLCVASLVLYFMVRSQG
jgi:hypothetical protein